MTTIPQAAIDAGAQALDEVLLPGMTHFDMAVNARIARTILEAAEQAWPHQTIEPITHASPPPGGDWRMPCCGRTPYEVPRTDDIALDHRRVTCRPPTLPARDTVSTTAAVTQTSTPATGRRRFGFGPPHVQAGVTLLLMLVLTACQPHASPKPTQFPPVGCSRHHDCGNYP